jgi:phosphoribosylformylglycinamidine synthase subunit PurL
MPDTQVQPLVQTPSPATITPELLKQHSITADEYVRIEAALGRVPSMTELGIFSVMWSEHCSYKSSRVHLKRLPTRGERKTGPGSVVQGPGENAGIIDVGDGWACAFKIESHNHPSYIEPYQGAATGVGGILRDIFTMNARPLAVMDSLRFGPLEASFPLSGVSSQMPADELRAENRQLTTHAEAANNHRIMTGVVHGVAGYGNCFGVPNLGGETRFEPCYSGNPLLNAFALGLVRRDEIFYAKATGVGNPVIYVGAKTGRDGIHGATMASEEFTEGSEQKRPNVQMGDPFMEKLLLEACLEAMATGAVLGIQDMGAAGLTCSTCEMGARGGLGLTVELDRVPQRETGMTSYEIMLSESQERMLLVADKERAVEVLDVFSKWGLDASIVGEVTEKPHMVITQQGVLVADIPNQALTDDAPLYHRPVGVWKAPVPLDPPAWVLEELKKPRDYTADLKKLLASANICDKRWVFEQYDSMVQTNTVQGPGGEAGVMRIKGTGSSQLPVVSSQASGGGSLRTENGELTTSRGDRGLAMALAGNGRWTYLDPKLGAMHAVAEAARKVACTGATPVAATNCLNFGNPEKPEIMAQLSQAIDGIAEACNALGTPVTGGNVSLYNETKGEGIYPTPVLGVVGIIEDVTKAVPASFQKAGDSILLIFFEDGASHGSSPAQLGQQIGSSEFARTVLGEIWGTPPALDIAEELALHKCLRAIVADGYATSITDVSDGGIVVSLAKAAFPRQIGFNVQLGSKNSKESVHNLFAEYGSSAIVTCAKENVAALRVSMEKEHTCMIAAEIGETVRDRTTVRSHLGIFSKSEILIDTTVQDLSRSWAGSLEQQLADEVVTA